ncbi:MAG: TrkH family potassium uptake protein, partial [Candidatus Altiarchaeales archaeon]|nr:TrkH family potassium uptake protein [Candidatus Altiarchaeales archaeon]
VLIGGVRWLLRKYSLPESAVVPFKLGGRIFYDNEVRTIALFFFIYVLLLGVGCFVLMLYGMGATDAFFVSASAQGTNGITTVDLRDLPAVPKVVLIIQMITGRLEIFPLLVLIGYFIHKAEREVIVAEHKAERRMKLRGRGQD